MDRGGLDWVVSGDNGKDVWRPGFVGLAFLGYVSAFTWWNIKQDKSWPKKKKAEINGKPHQQKPDADNLAKALMDAVHKDDSGVWDIRATKVWAERGAIDIRDSEPYSLQSHCGESKLIQKQAG